MNCSTLILVTLIFNAATLLLSSSHSHETDPSPGMLEKLMEIVATGDDPDGIVRLMDGYPHRFSRKFDEVLNAMIKLDRSESFCCLFGLLEGKCPLETLIWPRSDEINEDLNEIFWNALRAHRPKICKFLMSLYPPHFSLTRSLNNLDLFWGGEPALWALDELLEVVPPGSRFASFILAPADVFSECATLEACLLALEFNKQHIQPTKRGIETCSYMLLAFLQNKSLGDEGIAALIHRFSGWVRLKDERVEAFIAEHPDFPLSRLALIAGIPEKKYEGYPSDVLDGLCKISFEQLERLKQIIAEGDNPQEIASVLGYCQLALGKRIYEIMGCLIEQDRSEAFKLLFSVTDFANFSRTQDLISRLIRATHDLKRKSIFQFLVMSDQFDPDQFLADSEASDQFAADCERALTSLVDVLAHVVAVNARVDAVHLSTGLTLKLLRNQRLSEQQMLALLQRLVVDLGAALDEDAVDILQKYHPDYELARQFLVGHLPVLKEPVDS